MGSRLLASALVSTALCLPAFAQQPAPEPAAAGTAESAAALRETLATYVTQVPFERGILRVEPDPAGERITLDPSAALSEIVGSPVRFSPLRFVVSQRSDGNWNVFSGDPLDVAAEPEIEGMRQTFEYRQEAQHFRGIFSPDLAGFVEGEGTASGTTNVQSDALSRSTATIGETTVSMTGRPGTDGGADFEIRQGYRDYRQSSTVTLPEDSSSVGTDASAMLASFGFEASAASVDTNAALKDGRTRAIRDLYALVLRNASSLESDPKATLAGSFGKELKEALRAALPLWQSLDGEASARDLAITSLYGAFKVAEASQTLRFTGVATDASFDVDMRMAGITATSPFLPPWSATLMPEEIAIGFALSGADIKTPAELALTEIDFSQDPPLSPDAQERVAASFDAARISTKLKPGRIRSQDFDVTFSGDLRFQDEKPSANVTVEAVGIDRTIATLQAAAASQPELHQAVGVLQFAKGVGRPKGEDRLEWIVAAAADGSVTVNGTMVKGPDPVIEEDPLVLDPLDDMPDTDSQPSETPKATP